MTPEKIPPVHGVVLKFPSSWAVWIIVCFAFRFLQCGVEGDGEDALGSPAHAAMFAALRNRHIVPFFHACTRQPKSLFTSAKILFTLGSVVGNDTLLAKQVTSIAPSLVESTVANFSPQDKNIVPPKFPA
jgi:hypothetical protein